MSKQPLNDKRRPAKSIRIVTTWLQSLERFSVLVADTGDLDQIAALKPRDATTNPTLLLRAAQMPRYRSLIEAARRMAGGAGDEAILTRHLAVQFGCEILRMIPGRVSTEVEARLSFDTDATVQQALQIRELYQQQGFGAERLLIKLAATWEGIRAAEQLERQGVQCNLTLIFSFAQAVACAEAGVTLISPFVGRITDWHRQRHPARPFSIEEDPGVQSVQRIYQHFKQRGYRTEVMAASFRQPEQVAALSGCDLLTVSPEILRSLAERQGELPRRLTPQPAESRSNEAPLSEAEYRWRHNQDAMAVEKLAEGIRCFDEDGQRLLNFLRTLPAQQGE